MSDVSAPLEMSAVKLALAAQEARQSLDPGGASLLSSEPIAIIGMSCRFPGGADDPEKFWRLLVQGGDAVTRIPADRWDPSLEDADASVPGKHTAAFGGLISDIAGFDADHFGIAPREATRMDPQQRLLLEVTWDALRDAGCRVDGLRGSATGVFVAIYGDDYARHLYADWDGIDAHTASGNSHGVAAGRIAYLLDLRGPAIAVDTACSSSLVAVHTACRSLRDGETSLALVGAASLLISPEQSVALSKWGMMAPDGHCKVFDASADGWVRGEGAGVLVLKRLADALGDGDRVHAVIRGTALNQDGRSATLTAPNGFAQRAVLRAALANARVPASRVTYVEAHGTGTSVGDPIELEALVDEIGGAPGDPCFIGAVKANIGHLEAAAGLAGLIKVVQAMRHERIPPQPHFHDLNPLVSLDGTRLRIAPEGQAWPADAVMRVAGISAFGFGGTNAHVILEEAPRIPQADAPADVPWLLTLSAAHPDALRELAGQVGDALDASNVRDVCWTVATHDALRYRVAVVGSDAVELAHSVREAATGDVQPVDSVQPVAFVFSGHGSQWAGMARESLARNGTFAQSMRESDAIIRGYADWSAIDVLTDDAQSARLDDTDVFQPVLVALQLAIVEEWRAVGVEPATVIGHSVGELTAACVAGALSHDQVLRIALERGRLMQAMAADGAMIAAQGDEAVIRAGCAAHGLVVAGENAAGMLTLSGSADAIQRCKAELEGAGIACHRVRVSRAFHSTAIEPAASALRRAIGAVVPRGTAIPMYSSVTGARIDGSQLDAAYWERNARDVVRFGVALGSLLDDMSCDVVEVSPHPVLLAAVQATIEQRGKKNAVTVPTWRRGRGERATLLTSAGALWCNGVPVERDASFENPGQRVSLPGYPWQHRAAWAGAPMPIGRPVAAPAAEHTLPGHMTEVPALGAVVFQSLVRATDDVVREHRVQERVVVPGTMILLAVLAAAERGGRALIGAPNSLPLALREVVLDRALAIAQDGARTVQIALRRDGDAELVFDVASRAADSAAGAAWQRHASGTVIASPPSPASLDVNAATLRCTEPCDAAQVYATLTRSGIDLGPPFRLLTSIAFGTEEALATLREADGESSLASDAARLDAALHAIGALIVSGDDGKATWMPVSYGDVMITRPAAIAASHVTLRSDASTSPDHRVADVALLDADGAILGTMRGVRVQRADRAHLTRLVGATGVAPVLRMAWEPVPAQIATAIAPGERWLVVENAVGSPVADAMELAGAAATRVRSDALVEEDTARAALFDALFSNDAPPYDGVMHAAGLASDSATDLTLVAGSALVLLRELAVRGASPKRGVLLMTRGAAEVVGDVLPGDVADAALLGLRNTASAEHPELNVRAVDFAATPLESDLLQLLAESRAEDAAPRIAYRGGERLAARLVRELMDESPSGPVALLPPSPRVLEALAPVAFSPEPPAAGMVEISVEAAGLNFRDVLGALGMVTLPTDMLGGECAGIVSRIGVSVTDLAVGDRVVAFAPGALRTHISVNAALVAPMPAWMAFPHAGALPVAYLTAYHSLVNVARLQRGQRVLIHAAAGGVGLAAVHVAQWLGAEVVGTAGAQAKRAYLASIGVRHLFDSRSASFREALTDAAGLGTVHAVLNALSDDFIPMSLDVLAAGGQFVEIGKRGIWSAEAVRERRPDVTYTVFDVADIASVDATFVGDMLRTIMALVGRGALPVLPTTSFALHECRDAFRFMAQAKQIGKLSIVMPTAHPTVRRDGTHLVTGAYGALGRAVVERLVNAGARALALLARREPGDDARAWISSLAARGVTVLQLLVDVGDRDAVAHALGRIRRELPPIRSVVHTVGVNDDGAIIAQTTARLRGVARGKVDGAAHLDALTREDPLEFFVLFSSVSGVLGWPGQSTYAAANTALDQVASQRRASGRPAVSMQWGAWAGGGMADRVADRARRFDAAGLHAFEPTEALELFMALRASPQSRLAVVRADWHAFAAQRPSDAHLFSALEPAMAVRSSAVPAASATRSTLLADEIRALPESLRADAISDAVKALAVRALGLAARARIDPTRALRDLGLDSLMAVELRNAIGAAVDRTLPATLLFEHPSVSALSAYVATLIAATGGAPVAIATMPTPSAAAPPRGSELDAMSDEEAEALLLEELAASRATTPRAGR